MPFTFYFWLNAVHAGKAIIKIITHGLAVVSYRLHQDKSRQRLEPIQMLQEKRIGLAKVDQAF
jgi:hypothetical protein